MSCDNHAISNGLDAYLDGEMTVVEVGAVEAHLRQCPECTSAAVAGMLRRKSMPSAGRRYAPTAAFRDMVKRSIASPASPPAISNSWWRWSPLAVAAAVLLLAGGWGLHQYTSLSIPDTSRDAVVSEIADLHAATLASPTPVDVVSTDRHTVKPWFQGKLPFSFSLPELNGSPFTLLGGRVSYLHQSPGAELLFAVRQHRVSVFIFQSVGVGVESPGREATATHLGLHLRSWSAGGLSYFVIGDAAAEDVHSLSDLLKVADRG